MSGASTSDQQSTYDWGTPATDVWVRVSYYLDGGSGTYEATVLKLADSAGGIQGSVSASLNDGLMRVYAGDRATLLGTSTASGQFRTPAWHTVEVHWQMLSLTNGNIEVWMDGAQWIVLNGVDNVNTSNLNMRSIRLINNPPWASSATACFDDLAINDTTGTTNNGRIGDGRVVLLMPNGAGSATNMLRGGTDTGANCSQVNEVPPSAAQYVYSGTVGTADSYALQDIPTGSWQVNCVDLIGYALLSDPTGGALGLTVKSGPTAYESPPQTLTIAAQYVRQHLEVDPNTNASWSTTAVNALEIGTTVR